MNSDILTRIVVARVYQKPANATAKRWETFGTIILNMVPKLDRIRVDEPDSIAVCGTTTVERIDGIFKMLFRVDPDGADNTFAEQREPDH